MADYYDTANGSFSFAIGYTAAHRATVPLAQYTEKLNAQNSGATRDAGSADKIGSAAGVVGAIANIAGLVKSSQKNGDVLDMDVINYSDYPVVPYEFSTAMCPLRGSPRAIYTGDNTLIHASDDGGFVQNESYMNANFIIGSDQTVKVRFEFRMKELNQWVINNLAVDDYEYNPSDDYHFNGNDYTDTLCCTSFESESYPSFHIFFHTVMYATAKSFIIFTST